MASDVEVAIYADTHGHAIVRVRSHFRHDSGPRAATTPLHDSAKLANRAGVTAAVARSVFPAARIVATDRKNGATNAHLDGATLPPVLQFDPRPVFAAVRADPNADDNLVTWVGFCVPSDDGHWTRRSSSSLFEPDGCARWQSSSDRKSTRLNSSHSSVSRMPSSA